MKADFGKEFIRTGAGKGDVPRPVDRRKFRENYDQIDWSKTHTHTDEEKLKKVRQTPDKGGSNRRS